MSALTQKRLADRLEDLEWLMHPGMGGVTKIDELERRLGLKAPSFARQLWRHGLGKFANLFEEREHRKVPGGLATDRGPTTANHYEETLGELPWRLVKPHLREALTQLGREPHPCLSYADSL
jgi:hypothetical protein